MTHEFQNGIIKQINFLSNNLKVVQKLINEIINDSLNIALFFDDTSSNEIIEIPKENLNKNEISSYIGKNKILILYKKLKKNLI